MIKSDKLYKQRSKQHVSKGTAKNTSKKTRRIQRKHGKAFMKLNPTKKVRRIVVHLL